MKGADVIRFWSKVRKTDSCWLWLAGKFPSGYGAFSTSHQNVHRTRRAHRVAFEILNGPVPRQMFVLHGCDNRACVNPAHLRLGTHDENMADKVARQRQVRGELNRGGGRLSRADVAEIKRRLGEGQSGASVARAFGVSAAMVSLIRLGRNWSHV